MATTQFRVEDERDLQDPSGRRPSWMKGCLIGCLATVVVVLLLGTVATIWIYRNAKDWAAAGISTVVKQGIDQSDLPPQEKDQIKVEIDRAANAFKSGQMSAEQAALLMQNLMESPLMTTLAAAAVEAKYLNKSGLSDEEKAEAKVTLQRFLRGSIDQDISKKSSDAAISHIADRQPDGNYRIRDKFSDADLRAFLAEAKKAADEAQIPEQPQEFDPSDEVKRIIDEALMEPAPPDIDIPPPMKTPSEAESPTEPTTEN